MADSDEADPGTLPTVDAPLDLSYLVRMDLRVVDPDALVMGARLALATAEPQADPAELERQVGSVEDALFAYANTLGLDALLEDAPGVEVRTVAAEIAYGLDEITIEAEGSDGPDDAGAQ